METTAKQQLLKVLRCLIETAKRETDLENVYGLNDESVSWREVQKTYAYLNFCVQVLEDRPNNQKGPEWPEKPS
jgi:hypothetical protein